MKATLLSLAVFLAACNSQQEDSSFFSGSVVGADSAVLTESVISDSEQLLVLPLESKTKMLSYIESQQYEPSHINAISRSDQPELQSINNKYVKLASEIVKVTALSKDRTSFKGLIVTGQRSGKAVVTTFR